MSTERQQSHSRDAGEAEQVILTAREWDGFHEVVLKLQKDASGRFREIPMTAAAKPRRAATIQPAHA